MKTAGKIEPQAFEKMLGWLDEDREIAGQKYEKIRLRLIKILQYRGCFNAEELADATFDRVVRKIDRVIETCKTAPVQYFLGVANHIYQEFSNRTPKFEELPDVLTYQEADVNEEEFQIQSGCLKKCMEKLSVEQRAFILEYYAEQTAARIKKRKQLAEMAGAGKTNVRVQAFRLRNTLQKCVLRCLKGNEG